MTGVPRIILSASSRNWSAVQTATRGQSHQLVHMTVCRGRLLSLLWPVHGRTTWVPGGGDRGLCSGDCCQELPFLSNQHIPGEGGRTGVPDTAGLGAAVWARPRGSKWLLPPGTSTVQEDEARGGWVSLPQDRATSTCMQELKSQHSSAARQGVGPSVRPAARWPRRGPAAGSGGAGWTLGLRSQVPAPPRRWSPPPRRPPPDLHRRVSRAQAPGWPADPRGLPAPVLLTRHGPPTSVTTVAQGEALGASFTVRPENLSHGGKQCFNATLKTEIHAKVVLEDQEKGPLSSSPAPTGPRTLPRVGTPCSASRLQPQMAPENCRPGGVSGSATG